MTERTWLLINIYLTPFLMGAIWEFCAKWVSVPAMFLLSLHWIGALLMVYEKIKEKK